MLKYNQLSYWHFLTDKRDFNKHFHDYVKRDWVYVPDMTYNDFKDFVKAHDNLLVKPNEMYQGVGIRKLGKLDNESDYEAAYKELSSQKCLLEEFIKQHPAMIFGAKSVNTIRMYTFIDNEGKAHCLKAILRAGVGDTVVDNFHAGGVIYEVDMETGVVDCQGMQRGENGIRLSHKIHPGTDIVMIGYKIPNWTIIVSSITKVAELLPECRYVGWDIAVTEDDMELIEGNHDADYELLEFIGEKGWRKKIKKYL